MRNFALVLALLFLIFALLIYCNNEQQAETSMEDETVTQEQTLGITPDMLTVSKDLVCGMELTAENLADTVIYAGQLYGFCSDQCKAAFKLDPDAALSVLEQEKSQEE